MVVLMLMNVKNNVIKKVGYTIIIAFYVNPKFRLRGLPNAMIIIGYAMNKIMVEIINSGYSNIS